MTKIMLNISKSTSDKRFSVCLEGTEQVIGRAPGSDIRLPFSAVSSSHCRLTVDSNGRVMVTDLGSTNGTQLGGSTVEANTPTLWSTGLLLEIDDIKLELITEQPAVFDEPEEMSREISIGSGEDLLNATDAESASIRPTSEPEEPTPPDEQKEAHEPQEVRRQMSVGMIAMLAAALFCFFAAAFGLYWVAAQ